MEEEEIYHLNAYQYISVERIVYGKEKMDLDFVREPLKDERRKNRAVNPVKRGCRLMSNYAEKYWRMHIS